MSMNARLAQPPFPWFYDYWLQFTSQVMTNRLPHAILLKGIDGIGGCDLAVAMAQYLLCRSPAEANSCGHCRSCELLDSGSHPDFTFLQPEEGSSVIKIGQVRELTRKVSNTAQQGGRKVIVVAPAEFMNTEAANAILKNLEEPAGDTVFILVSYQSARLMPTIRSRTSQISLSSPSWEDSLAWLRRNQVSQPDAVLQATAGAPVKAMAWQDGNQLEAHDGIASAISDSLKNHIAAMDVAKKLATFELTLVLELTLGWLQRAIKVACAQREDSLSVVRMLAEIPPKDLYSLLDNVSGRLVQLRTGTNPNVLLVCEELVLIVQGLFARLDRHRAQG
jgi:DNA polymerase-3 subunit delta'